MIPAPELQRLRADRASGATVLGELACAIVQDFVATSMAAGANEFAADLEELIREILLAQPSMAVMLNLAQAILNATVEQTSLPDMKERVRHALRDFQISSRKSMEALCAQAIQLLPPRASVLTYSNSTSVTAVLLHARANGHLDRVFLSEARPAFDGRVPAASLTEVGVTVDYSTDMALFARLKEADLVLLGADAIFPAYFLNKVGTHALAELARVRDVPCFAVCVASKCLPTEAAMLLKITKHSRDEVWPDALPGVRVHNDYFEEIPVPLLTGILTDHGLRAPDDLRSLLHKHRLPPALLRLADETGA